MRLVGTRLFFVVLVAGLVAPWFNVPRDQADSAGMMAHLHTFFVGADLLYDDEYAALGMSPLFAFVTDAGVVSNHWPSGATWLQAPGYGLGLLASQVLTSLGVGKATPMGVVPWLGVRTWAMLVLFGLVATMVHCTRSTGASVRQAAVLAWCMVVGTPLLYYAAEAPLRPHLWGAAITLAVVMLWSRPQLGKPITRTVTLAALVGLATYVRPQLVLLGLLVLHDWWTRSSERPARLLVVGLLVFVSWPLVHARIMLWMYGADLWTAGGGVSRHLWHFLVSPHHGALSWSPVLVLALFALVSSVWQKERGAWLVGVIVLAQIWIDAGMKDIEPMRVLGTRTWAGGTGFGARKLVDVLPLFLPAVWSSLQRARASGRGRELGVLVLALVLTVPTLLLHLAAVLAPETTTGAVHDWPSLLRTMVLPFDPAAWGTGLRARSLPLLVPLVVGAVVAVPLAGAMLLAAQRAASRPADAVVHGVGVATLGAAVVAHAWVAVLLARSDAILHDDPHRMARAREQMQARHVATVARIPASHAFLRERLGPGAAPMRAPRPQSRPP